MVARLLESIPISGSVDEVRFDALGDCTWVEFGDLDSRWVGVFGRGHTTLSSLTRFDVNGAIFVIAGGQGYVIDLAARTCSLKTSCSILQSAIPVSGADMVIACDFTDIFAYGLKSECWSSDRIAHDGIRLDRANQNELFGEVCHPSEGWSSFTYDMKTHVIIRESLLSPPWDNFD